MHFFSSLGAVGPFRRAWLWQAGVFLSLWAELYLFSEKLAGPLLNPVLFYLSSVLMCVFATLYWLDRPVAPPEPARASRRAPLAWAGLVLGSVLVLYAQAPVIAGHAIDVRSSDIIPILQAYVSRFRSGEVVYRYLTTLPYPLFPNHLPLQWLPYVPADQLGIDYRWWSLGILLLVGFGAYQTVLVRQALSGPGFLARVMLPTCLLYYLITHNGELYAHPVEPTIIAYYCVLAASVLSRSALLQAAALVLCLLSRYSVVFWVPFYLWVLWREAGRYHALLVAGLVLAGIVSIYVVPFLSKDWTIFTHALSEYRISTLGEWGRTDGEGGMPPQLFGGVGLAAWFYTYGPEDLSARITLIQATGALLSIGAVLVAAGAYYRFRLRFDYRIFALVALKFYLATFYAFIQTPYAYLESLGLFISVFVVMMTGTGLATSAARPAIPTSTSPLLPVAAA